VLRDTNSSFNLVHFTSVNQSWLARIASSHTLADSQFVTNHSQINKVLKRPVWLPCLQNVFVLLWSNRVYPASRLVFSVFIIWRQLKSEIISVMKDRTLRSNGQALLHTNDTRDLSLDLAVDILRVFFCVFFQALPGKCLQYLHFCSVLYNNPHIWHYTRRSQWPQRSQAWSVLPARTLGSSVQIQFETRMSLCVYSVFVLSCVQIKALRRADPPSEESYWLCIGLRNWKKRPGPNNGL
jgi:hypothetical protein